MNTKQLATKLVDELENLCAGIRHDYDLREIEMTFDSILNDTLKDPRQGNLRF